MWQRVRVKVLEKGDRFRRIGKLEEEHGLVILNPVQHAPNGNRHIVTKNRNIFLDPEKLIEVWRSMVVE